MNHDPTDDDHLDMRRKDADEIPDKYARLADRPRTQAISIINKMGGAYTLAELIGVSPSTVYKWTYNKDEHPEGTGGIIPTRQHEAIKRAARREGILLTSRDWYPDAFF